jgi:hypothetical protein
MYAVAPGQALPLEYEEEPWRNHTSSSNPQCGAAVVQIVGLPSTCVFWQSDLLAGSEQLASVDDPQFRDRSVRLEGTEGLHRLAIGSRLEARELLSPPASEPRRLLGFSGRVAAPNAVLEAVTELPDGCLAIEHRAMGSVDSAARSTIYLCVPRWAFPFLVGSELVITSSSRATDGAHLFTIAEPGGPRRLELSMNAPPDGRIPIPLEASYHTRCGAYVETFGLQTLTGVIGAGETSDSTSDGVRTRILLGRAERVLVAPASCEAERASIGTRFDLLTVKSLETDP